VSANNNGTQYPRTIFLTGATGFLGAFVLDELLRRTGATVYALVRGADAGESMTRLRSALAGFRIDASQLSGRVVPVPGDLTKPLLGMSEGLFGRLAAEVDEVYHSGANVNFAYPYAALKPANVDGTREVIRLCVRDRIKRLHHVSAVDAIVNQGLVRVREADPLPKRPMPHGYVQSKWAAERLVLAAEDRGLPVTIYRPWLTGVHSRTGACHTTDYILRLLRACLEVGIVPDYDEALNITPVDYYSQALVHISLQTDSKGQRYHLANPVSTPLPVIYEWLSSYGYHLDVLPFHEWRERLIQELPPGSPGYSVLPLIPQHPVAPEARHPSIDCTNTLAALEGTSIECPPLSEHLVHLCLTFLAEADLLEAPTVARDHQLTVSATAGRP
jgi:myxalamid-type nonribosomal peptide synthetase MxaA